jgi:hypothetical protein
MVGEDLAHAVKVPIQFRGEGPAVTCRSSTRQSGLRDWRLRRKASPIDETGETIHPSGRTRRVHDSDKR